MNTSTPTAALLDACAEADSEAGFFARVTANLLASGDTRAARMVAADYLRWRRAADTLLGML